MSLSILQFPYELTHAIVQELNIHKDRQTLIALSSTCMLLHSEADEQLYQHMSDKNITTQHLFMSMLARHPIGTQRAKHMKVYHAFETPDFSFAAYTNSTPNARRLAFLKMLTLLERALPAAVPKLTNLKELSIPLDPWGDREFSRGNMPELWPYLGRWASSQQALFELMAGEGCTFELESFACRNVLAEQHYAILAMFLRSQPGLRRLTFLNEVLPMHNQLSKPTRPWLDDLDTSSIIDTNTSNGIANENTSKTASNLVFFRGRLKSMTTFLPLAQGQVEMLVWEVPPQTFTQPPFPMPLPRSTDSSVESPFFNPIASYMKNVKFLTIQSIDWGIPNLRKSLLNLQCLHLESFVFPDDLPYLTTLRLQILLVPHYESGLIQRATRGLAVDRSPERMYTVDRDILPQCPNIRYGGDCFSIPVDRSDYHQDDIYRIWDSRSSGGTEPEKYEISKVALMCHHVFELLPRKYLS